MCLVALFIRKYAAVLAVTATHWWLILVRKLRATVQLSWPLYPFKRKPQQSNALAASGMLEGFVHSCIVLSSAFYCQPRKQHLPAHWCCKTSRLSENPPIYILLGSLLCFRIYKFFSLSLNIKSREGREKWYIRRSVRVAEHNAASLTRY